MQKEVLRYLLSFLLLDTVHAPDKESLIETLTHWSDAATSFADARLRALAATAGLPVCSVNRRQADHNPIFSLASASTGRAIAPARSAPAARVSRSSVDRANSSARRSRRGVRTRIMSSANTCLSSE